MFTCYILRLSPVSYTHLDVYKRQATEKGELNRNIQKANRLIREIRAQIGKLKEWIADLFKRGKPPRNSRRNLPTLQIC